MTSKKMRNVVLAFASASLLGSLLIGVPAAKAATGTNCKLSTPAATAACALRLAAALPSGGSGLRG